LLANCGDILAGDPSLLTAGTPKTDIEQGLTATLGDGSKWNATSTNPTPAPMHGEVSGGSSGIIIGNGQNPFNGIPMTRMTARINLTNNDPGNFTVEHIHLYNLRRSGQVIPGQTPPTLPATELRHTQPLQYGPGNNEIYIFEQDPSDGQPESNKPFMLVGGEYKNSGTTTWYRIDFVNRENEGTPQADNEFIPLIRNRGYTFTIEEVNGPGYGDPAEAAQCLPINIVSRILVFDDGGIENILFDGQYYLAISHETMEFDKDAGTQVLHIETDNPLKWKIQQQGGTSWLQVDRTTPGATDDGNVDITASAYDNATQPRTATLLISAGKLQYPLPVEQSYLDAISLEIIHPETREPINEVLFRSNPLDGGGSAATNPRFTVKWNGPQCLVNISMLGNRLIKLPAGLTSGATLSTNEQTFEINPDPFQQSEVDPQTGNPFLEEGAAVTFTVQNGQQTETRTLYIRHECISIIIDDPQPFYYMGHQYQFGVRSNTTWKITGATTELPQLFMNTSGQDFTSVLNTTGGNDKKDGSHFTVQVETPVLNSALQLYGIGRAGRKMKLTFTDDAGIAPPITKTFTAVTQDPNSYRVRNGGGNYTGGNLPGSYGRISFPIRKLFWAWEADLQTELNPATSGPLNLSAELIWQTSAGLIQSGGAFEFKDEGGQNDWRDYCVSLWSDNRQNTRDLLGNALIAIKNNNEILWSFHIWVTDYFPDNTPAMGKTFTNTAAGINPAPILMDYNLGATISYTQFDPHQSVVAEPVVSPAIGGLYYQAGRKDPIPGPRQLSTAGTHTLNENNQLSVVNTNNQRVYTTFQTVSEHKNLRNSIQNPTIYYTGAGGLNDWYTTGTSRTDQNDFLWIDKEGMKALYDPCPAGWKVGKK